MTTVPAAAVALEVLGGRTLYHSVGQVGLGVYGALVVVYLACEDCRYLRLVYVFLRCEEFAELTGRLTALRLFSMLTLIQTASVLEFA